MFDKLMQEYIKDCYRQGYNETQIAEKFGLTVEQFRSQMNEEAPVTVAKTPVKNDILEPEIIKEPTQEADLDD